MARFNQTRAPKHRGGYCLFSTTNRTEDAVREKFSRACRHQPHLASRLVVSRLANGDWQGVVRLRGKPRLGSVCDQLHAGNAKATGTPE